MKKIFLMACVAWLTVDVWAARAVSTKGAGTHTLDNGLVSVVFNVEK